MNIFYFTNHATLVPIVVRTYTTIWEEDFKINFYIPT